MMTVCSYCGTKLDDSAKFCTACGAKVEQSAPVQEPVPAQESAPQQGSYTAPTQGSYTAPSQGSYTPPVQQPISAADSGSYTPPAQQSYSAGTSYAPKAKAAKAPKQSQGGKRKLGPIIGIAVALLLVIVLIASCGGKDDAVPASEQELSGAQESFGTNETANSGEVSPLQQQWNGTWYGVMYVYEAEGDFAGIEYDENDVYMVVDVDEEGKGTYEVYFANVDEPYATAECRAYDYGMDTLSGSIVDMLDMDTYNWMFRPVPDYPDRYTITDSIEYDDSLFEYTLFFKQWGKSWQDEIEGDEILPPSVDEYEAAIASGELPPVGFAPIGYAGDEAAAVSAVVENPSVWYGWMSFTEFENIDSDDLVYDAWGYVDEDSDGNIYFEAYQDGYPDNAFMSMYADIEGSRIIPVIGDEDAWVSDTYLEEDGSEIYEGVLGADGVLRFDYFFTHYDGEYGYRVQMNFRVDGTEWDEDNDILPPRYDEYKAALGGAAESQPAQAAEPAAAEDPAQSAGGPSGFGGTHSFTVDEFMTEIEATFTFELPESGWVTETPNRTVYIYNVPTLDVAHSAAPRIQFELKESLEKIDFYKDEFENLKEIDSRTISGIEFKGRTYKDVGMEWIEYYGELPNGVWLSAKISGVDISDGTEGAEILDSVSIN